MALTQEQKELVEEVGTEVSKDLTGFSPEDVKYIKINVRELLSLDNLSKESIEELFYNLTEDY